MAAVPQAGSHGDGRCPPMPAPGPCRRLALDQIERVVLADVAVDPDEARCRRATFFVDLRRRSRPCQYQRGDLPYLELLEGWRVNEDRDVPLTDEPRDLLARLRQRVALETAQDQHGTRSLGLVDDALQGFSR